MGRTIEERVAVLEKGQEDIIHRLKRIEIICDNLHDRINDIITNDLAHIQQKWTNSDYAKLFGAGSVLAVIIDLLMRIAFG